MPHHASRRWSTADCEITVSDHGEIQVDHRQERQVRVTEGTLVGLRQAVAPVSAIIPGLSDFHRRNWWCANYAGAGGWNLDLDAGAQRYNGVTTGPQVRHALRVAGLGDGDIREALRLARKHTHSGIARHY